LRDSTYLAFNCRVTPACEVCLRLTLTAPCKRSSYHHRWLSPLASTTRHLKMAAPATANFVMMTRSGVPLPRNPTPPRATLEIHRHCRARTRPALSPLRSSENGKRLMEQRDPSPDRQPCTLTKRGSYQILSTPYSGVRRRRRLTRMTPYLPHSRAMTLLRPASL
jgi:hypothetical protein